MKEKEKHEVLNKEEILKRYASGQLRTQSDVSILIKEITGQVLEAVLKGELDAHLGYERYDRQGCKAKETTNRRNGWFDKRVKSQVGELALKIPRDRESEFEPALIKKGERAFVF